MYFKILSSTDSKYYYNAYGENHEIVGRSGFLFNSHGEASAWIGMLKVVATKDQIYFRKNDVNGNPYFTIDYNNECYLYSEGYNSKQAMEHSIALCKREMPTATVK